MNSVFVLEWTKSIGKNFLAVSPPTLESLDSAEDYTTSIANVMVDWIQQIIQNILDSVYKYCSILYSTVCDSLKYIVHMMFTDIHKHMSVTS